MLDPSLEVPEIMETVFGETIERDRFLSFHWYTLDSGIIRSLDVALSKNRAKNMASNSILTEAVLAYAEERWVSYSRHKSFYSGMSRYYGTAYTYATVLAAIDELLRLELIEEQRSSPGQRGWQSRFRATPKLVAVLAEAPLAFDMHEVIRLKDIDGKLVDYRDTDATLRMRRELQSINAALGAAHLDLPAAPGIIRTPRRLIVDGVYYRPTPIALRRIFNRGSFYKGGRVYGWWQALPKGRRQQLLIDGEPTAEPDFNQMHASILYAERGHVLIGDAYETGEFSRDMGKLAFFVALNARTRQGAISALLNRSDWRLSGRDTGRLLDALARRNAPIAADLHADRGIGLMKRDSEITIEAIKRCVRADIPIFPVHDSMLTPKHHEGRVAEIMEQSAAHVLKAKNPCGVRTSYYSVPQIPSAVSPFLSLSPGLGAPERQLVLFSDPPSKSFHAEMKLLRERLGLSQRALAGKLGCRQPHVANVERGHDRLSSWAQHRLRDLMREAA